MAADLFKVKDEIDEVVTATERLRNNLAKQDAYAVLRNEREKATFSMMMKMNPQALTNIRREFFARRDAVQLDEFMYIIQKHLINKSGDDRFIMETPEQREFGTNMYELFKDIDVNGDGQLEWQEFTSFTVEKANLLNKRAKLASIAHYYDSTSILDPSSQYRHRHDISRFVNLPLAGNFAMVEDHKNAIFIFNSRLCRHVTTITTEAAPIAIDCIPEKDKEFIVTSGADMTLSTYSLDDPNPKRRYKVLSTWATAGVQMALAHSRENRLLYSGATNGSIYSWNVSKRSLVTQMQAHSDIVMSLKVLQKLNNIVSASLDKTLAIFDSHTNEEILRLHGHRKGVFDLSYTPDYRLLFSCGFEHDALVWSPFVKSLVYRLKGHHASLVGVQTIPDTPEVISADISGVFKLWDVRNFQCIQTFSANLSGNNDSRDSSKLACFFHTKLPSANTLQKEDDSRIYAASKLLFSFDQARVVHEATTDYSNVFWIAWSESKSMLITASERNVIVWDAFTGSKMFVHSNICEDEISACCLDDRERKVVIGDIKGCIGVYNSSNGALMKSVYHNNSSVVVGVQYFDEAKRFLAGYQNGEICLYDENDIEECHLLRTFELFNRHAELLSFNFCEATKTVMTSGASSNVARLWAYDSGKCEAELHLGSNSQAMVVATAMLLPLPLVVVTDTLGNVIIWGSRGSRWCGLRISGFLNQTPPTAELEPTTHRIPGTDENTVARALPVGKPHRTNSMLACESFDGGCDVPHPPSRQRGLRASIHPMSELVKYDEILRTQSQFEANRLFRHSESKWGRVSPASCLSFDPSQNILLTGDDLGCVRCLDISDVVNDLGDKELLATEATSGKFKGICRGKTLDSFSALPPIYEVDHADEFDAAASVYLLGRAGNCLAYLGVQFKWAMTAHHDRLISLKVIPGRGFITSASDRMVKMWTFEGQPLGTLLQSVPVGMRNRNWFLELDVDKIIQQENHELDEIIDRAKSVASDHTKPCIRNMDFSDMETADFAQSALRQRVDKSTKILGLDFPTTTVRSSAPVLDTRSLDDISISDQTVSTLGSKPLGDALRELKSTDPAVDYELKTKQLSHIQQKRKASKLESISRKYEERTGIFIKTPHPTDAALTTQAEDEKSQADFDKMLTAKESDLIPAKDEHSVNNDMYSVEGPTSPLGRSAGINSLANGANSRRGSVARSKIAESIKEVHERGARTLSMVQSCRKYSAFEALDSAINTKVRVGNASPQELEEIRAMRDKKHRDLMSMITKTRSTGQRSSKLNPLTEGIAAVNLVPSAANEDSQRNRSSSVATQEKPSQMSGDGPSRSQLTSGTASPIPAAPMMDSPKVLPASISEKSFGIDDPENS